MEHREQLDRYEQRFRRAGLPLFIEDFSPTQDIFARATPLLLLVFLAEMLGATSLQWSWWQNLLAVTGALAVLICGFGVLNGLRGRRFWSFPTRFGIPELTVFVLLPALLPLVTERQVQQFFAVAASNLFLIGLVYAVVGYGLIGTTIWGMRRVVAELGSSVASLVRALPLLLVFSLVLFVNTEMWQVFAGMPTAFIIFAVVLFTLLGDAFLVFRLPGELNQIVHEVAPDSPPLRALQRVNLSVSLVIRQWLQVLVVSVGVGAFFVSFGTLAISEQIYESWGVEPGAWRIDLTLLGYPLVLSEALVKVATGIATFTGLYYSISLMTDATYRAEFLDTMTDELRDVFAVRADYLALRAQVSQSPSGPIAK
ncbi:hypothetical protein [Kribbella deserti]|uniref:Integral membrane protein n=1 Tax=Kribbella deserti TaxID=1926257 RepID=A0ABV6QWB8_9ACTN